MAKDNVIEEKTLDFAVKIIDLCRDLKEQKEYVISSQLARSGTSIGANVAEAIHAQSRADWYAKLKIADKEAHETEYWLKLLLRTDYISKEQFVEFYTALNEICSILIAICKTTKENDKRGS